MTPGHEHNTIEELSPSSVNPDLIRTMFTSVAHQYDLANSILSFGIHHIWRKKVVKLSGVKAGQSVLDCATGTGDLAIAFKRAVGEQGKVVGTDFCKAMLDLAPRKAFDRHLNIDFELADVMNLQFESKFFDVSSISFGIRNVQNPVLALSEMARVTKPGGKVIVLEFGPVEIPFLSSLYRIYSERLLPIIGGWITGQPRAYQYLQKSSAKFPSRHRFLKLMTLTGMFESTKYHTLSFGIAYIYVGVRR